MCFSVVSRSRWMGSNCLKKPALDGWCLEVVLCKPRQSFQVPFHQRGHPRGQSALMKQCVNFETTKTWQISTLESVRKKFIGLVTLKKVIHGWLLANIGATSTQAQLGYARRLNPQVKRRFLNLCRKLERHPHLCIRRVVIKALKNNADLYCPITAC